MAQAEPRSLPPVAARVDRALADIDRELNWLFALSPVDEDGLWERFRESGYRAELDFQYPPLELDFAALRSELQSLPVLQVESTVLQALLAEKQRELESFLELVELRGKRGFRVVSVALFGDADAALSAVAQEILAIPDAGSQDDSDTVGCEAVRDAADKEIAHLQQFDDDFSPRVFICDDLSAKLMVSQGDLYIAKSLQLPASRLDPLIQHEVGVHSVTYFNGQRQPMTTLASGLAGYDALQEGLGVLAEYCSGFLPLARLKVIAARVTATALIRDGVGFTRTFSELHEEYGLPAQDAFEVALRADRGGGLTKDVVYLRGLIQLLAYLAEDHPLEPLLSGKLALDHQESMQLLGEEGYSSSPAITPRFVRDQGCVDRLERARTLQVTELYQRKPNL